MKHPWSRRTTETHKAFAAFSAYRDLGPVRSIPKALVTYAKAMGKPTGKPRWFEEWSSTHEWGNRTAAFDSHLDAIRVKTIEAETAQDARDQLATAQLMLRKSIDGLLHAQLSGKDAIKGATEAIKLMRLLRGESTEHTETSEGMSIERFRELDREASAKLAAIEKGREPTTEGE